ncbi:unnamed protein product [Eretmochelys imbricata]
MLAQSVIGTDSFGWVNIELLQQVGCNLEGACTKLDEDILDIPLDDPDANAAAAKIQASFRGHMTRKKIKGGEIDRKSKDPECASSTRVGDLRNGD